MWCLRHNDPEIVIPFEFNIRKGSLAHQLAGLELWQSSWLIREIQLAVGAAVILKEVDFQYIGFPVLQGCGARVAPPAVQAVVVNYLSGALLSVYTFDHFASGISDD
jgi:hypothetical protein